MGLLDLFRKRPKEQQEDPAEKAPSPEDFAGVRLEVTATDGRVLFGAKLENIHGTTGDLYQFTESPLGEITEPLRVRLRGFIDQENMAVYMEGLITPGEKHIWKAEELAVMRVGKDRAFFRLDVNVDAIATTFLGPNAGDQPCKLVNISVGGACIASERVYREGDKFLLKVKLLEDRDQTVVFCRILRVIDKHNGMYEYGCKFAELDEATKSHITKHIFTSQVKKKR